MVSELSYAEKVALIENEIVNQLEQGQDITILEKKLAKLKTEHEQQIQREQFQAKADLRKERRVQVERLVIELNSKSVVVDRFIKARDSLLGDLGKFINRVESLRVLECECVPYLYGSSEFRRRAQEIPQSYLTPGLTLPTLASVLSECIADTCAHHLKQALEVLQSCHRNDMPLKSDPNIKI